MNITLSQQKGMLVPTTLLTLSVLFLTLSSLYSFLWPLLFVSLIPLFFVFSFLPRKTATICVAIVGFIHYSVIMYPLATINAWWWTIGDSFFWQHKESIYLLGSLFLAFVTNIFTFWLIFYVFGRFLQKKPQISLFLLPLMWIFLEFIRVKILFDLQWGIFGYQIAENLFFARAAAFGGPFALSFVIIFINFCLYLLIKQITKSSTIPATEMTVMGRFFSKQTVIPWLSLAMLLILLVGNMAWIAKRTDSVKIEKSVAILNPQLTTTQTTNKAASDHLISLIAEAANSQSSFIVGPENMFPLLQIDENTLKPADAREDGLAIDIFTRLTEISSKNPEKTLIIGLHTQKKAENFNSLVVFERGKITSIYNKEHLLPLTEKNYSFLEGKHIDPLSAGENPSKNGEISAISTQHGEFLPLICSEILVDQEKTAPDVIGAINISNDNIFDSPRVATHNKLMTRIRAIEELRPIIRSSKGGFSGAFDATGQEIPSVKSETGEILFTTVGYPRKSF